MKKFLVLIIILALIAFGLYMGYNSMISAPSNDDLILEFNVEKGSTYNSIAESLEKEGFIKNALCYKIYLKLNPVSDNLEYGKYYLPTNVDVKGMFEEKHPLIKIYNILCRFNNILLFIFCSSFNII